mgnify:CR=1 FL=1
MRDGCASGVPFAAERAAGTSVYCGMTRMSWTGAAPWLYDTLMRPLERGALARWRRALWADVPAVGLGLEVGFGTNANAAYRPATAQLVGIDLSEAMLARAGATRDGATALPAAVADVPALPFADGAFDWVVASLVFCEVADPLAGLHELRRVLRPGGSLHLLEHVEPSGRVASALARAVTRVSGPLFGEHYDRRTHETVDAAGFTRERTVRGLRDALVMLVAR